MFCSKCGTEIPDGFPYCAVCGKSATGSSAPSSQAPRPKGGAKPKIPDYMLWNILATLFCCLPVGIVGIIKSAKVNGATGRGDYATAREESEGAKKWLIINIVLTGLLYGAYIILAIVAAANNPGVAQ